MRRSKRVWVPLNGALVLSSRQLAGFIGFTTLLLGVWFPPVAQNLSQHQEHTHA